MSAPRVAIYNSTNTELVSNWDVGTLKAQRPSEVLTIKIWNNKQSSESVSDLKECMIMILDSVGDTSNDDVARDKWVQINCPAVDGNSNVWTAIGGTVGKDIKCDDNTVTDFTIRGIANDGIEANSTSNVATVNLRIVAPPNSVPGDKTFKVRLCAFFT
jgi:hypothetical protein